jgi:hypothetical protein
LAPQLAERFKLILGLLQSAQSCTAQVVAVFGIYPAQMETVEALRPEQLAPRLPAWTLCGLSHPNLRRLARTPFDGTLTSQIHTLKRRK